MVNINSGPQKKNPQKSMLQKQPSNFTVGMVTFNIFHANIFCHYIYFLPFNFLHEKKLMTWFNKTVIN